MLAKKLRNRVVRSIVWPPCLGGIDDSIAAVPP
jgi:hypothetical protein